MFTFDMMCSLNVVPAAGTLGMNNRPRTAVAPRPDRQITLNFVEALRRFHGFQRVAQKLGANHVRRMRNALRMRHRVDVFFPRRRSLENTHHAAFGICGACGIEGGAWPPPGGWVLSCCCMAPFC